VLPSAKKKGIKLNILPTRTMLGTMKTKKRSTRCPYEESLESRPTQDERRSLPKNTQKFQIFDQEVVLE
jgi:hypothetical protein